MSVLFERVFRQALVTFARENGAMFGPNFNALKLLVDQLTAKDLNIPPDLLTTRSFVQSPTRAPVKYLELFEHQTFTMSVFIVANKYTMPLHDHPGHGILRVVSGEARIQSYSLDQPLRNNSPGLMTVYEETPAEWTTQTESSVLTPTKCNIHEITAVGTSPAAFFDILSPPYESDISEYGPKTCLFYRKVAYKPTTPSTSTDGQTVESNSANVTDARLEPVYLQQIRAPGHYHCDDIPYDPPTFLVDLDAS